MKSEEAEEMAGATEIKYNVDVKDENAKQTPDNEVSSQIKENNDDIDADAESNKVDSSVNNEFSLLTLNSLDLTTVKDTGK